MGRIEIFYGIAGRGIRNQGSVGNRPGFWLLAQAAMVHPVLLQAQFERYFSRLGSTFERLLLGQ